jgi:hypothetical protein
VFHGEAAGEEWANWQVGGTARGKYAIADGNAWWENDGMAETLTR